MSEKLNPGIKHYRTLSATTPFTLSQLESFCTTLRLHGIDGDQKIYCSYQVELSVKIDEPLVSPQQLRSVK